MIQKMQKKKNKNLSYLTCNQFKGDFDSYVGNNTVEIPYLLFCLHIVGLQYQSALWDCRDQRVTVSFRPMSYFGVLFGCFTGGRVF